MRKIILKKGGVAMRKLLLSVVVPFCAVSLCGCFSLGTSVTGFKAGIGMGLPTSYSSDASTEVAKGVLSQNVTYSSTRPAEAIPEGNVKFITQSGNKGVVYNDSGVKETKVIETEIIK